MLLPLWWQLLAQLHEEPILAASILSAEIDDLLSTLELPDHQDAPSYAAPGRPSPLVTGTLELPAVAVARAEQLRRLARDIDALGRRAASQPLSHACATCMIVSVKTDLVAGATIQPPAACQRAMHPCARPPMPGQAVGQPARGARGPDSP